MSNWQTRVDAVWEDATLDDEARLAAIAALAAERPDDPVALFELAGAYDSAGQEADAEPRYRRALAVGLDEQRRVQAVIQLASTLRNLGRLDEALGMLRAEAERTHDGGMDDAVAAFLALALASVGREREGLAVALAALAPHLPRYTRSVAGYAAELVDAPSGMPTANTGEGPESRR
ncbi:tetratricopeptide repeat protein [Microbacterium sp. SORGH_AS_0888]|uniref:tetratricopeptide repeat protein n=1 Tax=Microbacterium sp. SORGH_AS_0888 TaxID=3041791 RepID=UPI00277D9EF0|nr:tetratricopeptide repeat protein [Microbacterium sp. SORGH_AS_0888]MDQ1128712.1 tetratricopeptide (TPR) repeat protein [Microbacterium sp. SORGH_AS_0888]